MNMKSDNEMYQCLLIRYHDYQEHRQKQIRIVVLTAPLLTCVCAAAALGIGFRSHPAARPDLAVQPEQTAAPASTTRTAATEPAGSQTAAATRQSDAPAAISDRSTETEQTAPPEAPETQTAGSVTAAYSQNEPSAETQTNPQSAGSKPVSSAQTVQTLPPAATAATSRPPAPHTTEPQTNPGTPGGPGAVFTKMTVSYDEAKEIFAHPILPCSRDDFLQYQAGIVSRNGNIRAEGAFCLSVCYEFADGQITLTDWDRMHGSDGDVSAEQTEYCGKTFFVRMPDDCDDRIRIAYYAAGFDPFELSGIEYQADFGKNADLYEIMDLIISLVF